MAEEKPPVRASSLVRDKATRDDRLGFDDYVRALVGIIRTCETPLTIGVFGEWGSGKTSLLRQVQKGVEAPAVGFPTVWFNAWKYDRKVVLWRALLLRVLAELRPPDSAKGKASDELRSALDELETRLYQATEREEKGKIRLRWEKLAKGAGKGIVAVLPNPG